MKSLSRITLCLIVGLLAAPNSMAGGVVKKLESDGSFSAVTSGVRLEVCEKNGDFPSWLKGVFRAREGANVTVPMHVSKGGSGDDYYGHEGTVAKGYGTKFAVKVRDLPDSANGKLLSFRLNSIPSVACGSVGSNCRCYGLE